MTRIENTESHPKRSTGTRVFLLIASAVTSLIAIGLLAFGGLALWGDSQKDERGYLSTDSHHFAASTHAIATENLDMDLDGVEELVDSTGLGDIRIDVAPQSGKPVFAGIARTDELSAYLRDVAHTTVTDLDFEPFEASYKRPGRAGHAGCARGRADLGSVQPGCRTADPHLGYRGRRMVDRRHERRRHVWRAGRHQRRGEGPVPERDRLERPRRRSDPAHRRGRAARLRPTPTPPAAPNGARWRLGPDSRLIPSPRIRPCCTEGPSL